MRIIKPHSILTTALSLLAVCSLTTHAEETTTSSVVYTGLEPVMTLECSPINFGVFQVARGNRGITGPTVVYLEQSRGGALTTSFANAGRDQIALSDKPEYQAQQLGECIIESSGVKNNDLHITREPAEGVSLAFTGASANPFAANLNAPTTQASNITAQLFVDETDPTLVRTDSDGNASFKIVGELNIPNNLTADNYGSYKGSGMTITVSDTPSGG